MVGIYKHKMATSYFEKPAFSPQADVTTVRPSSTAILAIDSKDRFGSNGWPGFRASQQWDPTYGATGGPVVVGANASPYDFTITSNAAIMNGYFTRLGITEVSFDWGVPNINVKTNRIYVEWSNYSTTGRGVRQILLNDGASIFMTPTEIAASIQTQVRAAYTDLSQFIMTYGNSNANSSGTPQFEYTTNVSNVGVCFQPLQYDDNSFNAFQYYPYPKQTKQLFDLLGFTDNNKTIIPPTILTTDQIQIQYGTFTYCQATKYVDIVCSQLVYNQALKDTMTTVNNRDILCRLYLNDANGFTANTLKCYDSNFCPPGCRPSTIYRQFQTPKMINWNSAGKAYQPVPGVLRFQVFDDAGAILTEMCGEFLNAAGTNNLKNTNVNFLDWSTTMLVSEN